MKNTLIFLHGGPGFKDYLRKYLSGFEKNFNCIFYDQLRGPDVTIEHLLDQLNDQVTNQNSKVYLVGHSWGGVLAVAYAIKYSNLISGLALMNTGLSSHHWFDEYQLEKEKLGLENAEVKDIFLTKDELSEGLPLLDFADRTFSEETFVSLNQTFLNNYDLIKDFSKLKLPILNIYGEKDVRFPKRVTEQYGKLNSSVINLEIKNAGHFPFLKQQGKEEILEGIKKYFL